MLANRSIPHCTVIPEIPYADVEEAARWLCDAFGFTVRIMIGNHRAQLNVGDCAMVVIEGREGDGARSCLVRVRDVDSALERAIQHGAKVLRAPADYPYGERQATVEDFAGHRWTFSQSIADVDPRDWGGTPGQL